MGLPTARASVPPRRWEVGQLWGLPRARLQSSEPRAGPAAAWGSPHGRPALTSSPGHDTSLTPLGGGGQQRPEMGWGPTRHLEVTAGVTEPL